jgi:hypothetical protein
MKKIVSSIVTVGGVDCFSTRYFVSQGLASEGNPVMAPIVGDWTFIVLKLVGTAIAGFLLWRIYNRHKKVGLASLFVALASYTYIIVHNFQVAL